MRSSKSVSRRMLYSMLIGDRWVRSSFDMGVRSMLFMYFSFENERSPLQLHGDHESICILPFLHLEMNT